MRRRRNSVYKERQIPVVWGFVTGFVASAQVVVSADCAGLAYEYGVASSQLDSHAADVGSARRTRNHISLVVVTLLSPFSQTRSVERVSTLGDHCTFRAAMHKRSHPLQAHGANVVFALALVRDCVSVVGTRVALFWRMFPSLRGTIHI